MRTTADAKNALLSILPALELNGGVDNHGSETRYQHRLMSLFIEICSLKLNQIDVESKFVLSGGVDVALYSDQFVGDFNKKQNSYEMIKNVRMLIEIKSLYVNGKSMDPKRPNTRLASGTILKDIEKLVITRAFLKDRGTDVATALMLFDTTEHDLRITERSLTKIVNEARSVSVDLIYFTIDGMTTYFNG